MKSSSFLESAGAAAAGAASFFDSSFLIGVAGAGVPFSTWAFLASPSYTGSGFGGRALISSFFKGSLDDFALF